MRAADRESNQSLGTDINIENTSNQSQFFESIAIPKCASSRGGTMKGTEISDLFAAWPPIRDELSTETSELQDDTIRECLPFLTGSTGPMSDHMKHGVPGLARYKHIDFLRSSLETMPAAFVGFDASRPWIVYWALTALRLLGEDLEEYRERVIQTFSSMQNDSGGFGGGHGQISHCAPSYAVVLSLAMVGGNDCLDLIDRKALWHWLGQIKRQDGGFRVCVEGEEDVRGGYCAMVMISLLGLPLSLPPDAPARRGGLESFVDGLPEYLSRCQTFEGGISGSPQTEAHGAYAFCALACLSILGPPHEIIPKHLDLPLLLSWLSERQYAPEGGFAGRTNKLVDGCYSHWVGGCWPLLEAAISGPRTAEEAKDSSDPPLYSHNGLARYIVACCQSEYGGLRDKPSKYPDGYHSCYTLAGLSATQNYNYYYENDRYDVSTGLHDAFRWAFLPRHSIAKTYNESEMPIADDRLVAIHPIFVIPWAAVEWTRSWSEEKKIF